MPKHASGQRSRCKERIVASTTPPVRFAPIHSFLPSDGDMIYPARIGTHLNRIGRLGLGSKDTALRAYFALLARALPRLQNLTELTLSPIGMCRVDDECARLLAESFGKVLSLCTFPNLETLVFRVPMDVNGLEFLRNHQRHLTVLDLRPSRLVASLSDVELTFPRLTRLELPAVLVTSFLAGCHVPKISQIGVEWGQWYTERIISLTDIGNAVGNACGSYDSPLYLRTDLTNTRVCDVHVLEALSVHLSELEGLEIVSEASNWLIEPLESVLPELTSLLANFPRIQTFKSYVRSGPQWRNMRMGPYTPEQEYEAVCALGRMVPFLKECQLPFGVLWNLDNGLWVPRRASDFALQFDTLLLDWVNNRAKRGVYPQAIPL
ncbi:hypothetical protein VNI00_016389 [Paramarasmius palmivorus]|uniref:F-box protein n=1 Tax=Paramarasmius palmivorus TaxID=297713 RepID=A0AAW0BEI3_9AGAR